MSNFDELIERLDAIDDRTSWLVNAMKALLANEAGVELADVDPFDAWMDEAPLDEYRQPAADPNEHIAVRTRPAPKKPPCPHNRQGIDGEGNVICNRCGFVLTSSGVVQRAVTASGAVVPVPGEPDPRWAVEQSPGASSKNPGGFLAPYSD